MLGHADFEAQNISRWHRREVGTVHDWDSLAWQPEAALAGAASGAFASAGPPTLAPIESSEAFLAAYQDVRGRLFTAVEQEIAWAAPASPTTLSYASWPRRIVALFVDWIVSTLVTVGVMGSRYHAGTIWVMVVFLIEVAVLVLALVGGSFGHCSPGSGCSPSTDGR